MEFVRRQGLQEKTARSDRTVPRARLRTINCPDAFVILKGMLQRTENKSAPLFLNKCMRVGKKLGLHFPEGVILASYTYWLEANPKGSLEDFLGAMDFKLVFGAVFDHSSVEMNSLFH